MPNNSKIKDAAIQLIRIATIIVCLIFISEHYFFEIAPFAVSPAFILSFLALVAINWYTKAFKKKDCFKLAHIPPVIILLLLAVFFRAVVFWALCTFPLRDANTVLLTLEEPFDDFAYGMVRICLTTTIPQTLLITAILGIFLTEQKSTTPKTTCISILSFLLEYQANLFHIFQLESARLRTKNALTLMHALLF